MGSSNKGDEEKHYAVEKAKGKKKVEGSSKLNYKN